MEVPWGPAQAWCKLIRVIYYSNKLPSTPSRYKKCTASPFWKGILNLFDLLKQLFQSKQAWERGPNLLLAWYLDPGHTPISCPHLFILAKDKSITVADFFSQIRGPLTAMWMISEAFRHSLSFFAFKEFYDLSSIVLSCLISDNPDHWLWKWNFQC